MESGVHIDWSYAYILCTCHVKIKFYMLWIHNILECIIYFFFYLLSFCSWLASWTWISFSIIVNPPLKSSSVSPSYLIFKSFFQVVGLLVLWTKIPSILSYQYSWDFLGMWVRKWRANENLDTRVVNTVCCVF